MSHSASDYLRRYFGALQDADAEALKRLTANCKLLENPFLNPARLVGEEEIDRAHRAILDNLEAIEFSFDQVSGDRRQAIACGRLSVTRHGDRPRELAFGAVIDCDGDGVRRLSLYCDTRNIRRWTDEAIL